MYEMENVDSVIADTKIQTSDTPADKLLENGGQPASTENSQEQKDLEDEYQFFRSLVKINIFKLTSVKEQRAISIWLHNCDMENDASIKCGTIKLMLVSLQHTDGPLNYFKQTDPEELVVNTYSSIERLLVASLDKENDADNYDTEDADDCRTVVAAVSADLTSFASTFADENSVQVFYARSDNVINTWHLPGHVQFPVGSRSSARWESALSTSPKTSRKIQAPTPAVENHVDHDVPVTKSVSQKICHVLMTDQESLADPGDKSFKWYAHSRLDGSLRPINDICVDKDICQHEKNQLEMDERAISVVNRVYPGHVRMVLDPVFIANVTGIKVNWTEKGLNSHDETLMIDAIDCKKTNGQVTLNSNVLRRPNAGEDQSVGATTESFFLDGVLNSNECCGRNNTVGEQSTTDAQEIAKDWPNDGVDQSDDAATDTDRTTAPETESEDTGEIMSEQNSERLSPSSVSAVNANDGLRDGEDSMEHQHSIETVLIDADENVSRLTLNIDEFRKQKHCCDDGPLYSDSLGNLEELPNDEKHQCVDTTLEAVRSTVIPEVRSETGELCRKENCCEPPSSDFLVNTTADRPNNGEDGRCATDKTTTEAGWNIIPNGNRYNSTLPDDKKDQGVDKTTMKAVYSAIMADVQSDIRELWLKVSELCGEQSNSNAFVNPEDERLDVGKAQSVDTITTRANRRRFSRPGPDIREFVKQTRGRRTAVAPGLSLWQDNHCVQLVGSPPLQYSPATVIVRRQSKHTYRHSGCLFSRFNSCYPRIGTTFDRSYYYTRFSAGSDNSGKKWLSAGNDWCAPQRNNNYMAPARQPANRETGNQQPRPAYPSHSTSALFGRPQQPRRRMTAHGYMGQAQQQPCNNPQPAQQPCNNRQPMHQQPCNNQQPMHHQPCSNQQPAQQQSCNNPQPAQQPCNNRQPTHQQPCNNQQPAQQQPCNNPQPAQQPCNNRQPAMQLCNNLRRNRRTTCDQLPAMNARPCTQRYTCDMVPEQPYRGGQYAIRRDTYDVPVPTVAQRSNVQANGGTGVNITTTYSVTGFINIVPDQLPGQMLPTPQPNPQPMPQPHMQPPQPPRQIPRPNTLQLDDYLEGIPRDIALPGCQFVQIDENMSGGNTPEDWRNPFTENPPNEYTLGQHWHQYNDRSSLGSAPMSIDASSEYQGNGYLLNDVPFPVHHEETQGRPRAASVGPCGRPRDAFNRNTR